MITTFVQSLAIDPASPATIYAGTISGIFKSTNGGDSWFSINTGTNFARVNRIVIDPSNASTIYIGTGNRGVLKTTNGGTTWVSVSTGQLPGSANIVGLVIDPLNPGTLYASRQISGPPNFFKTTDGGATWSASGLRF